MKTKWKQILCSVLFSAASTFGFIFTLSGPGVLAAEPNGLRCIIRSDLDGLLAKSVRTNMLAQIMQLPYIDGFHIQLFWKNFEPTNGVFNCAVVDECISAAEANGKKCSIALCACYFSPKWLMDSLPDSDKFTYTHPSPGVGTITSPVPWSVTYKGCLSNAIECLATNYDGVLDYITVTGPSSLYGVEVNFPCASIDVTNSTKLGFTRERFTLEWEDSIDQFYALFPNTPLCLALHTQIDLPTRTEDLVTAPALRSYLLNKVGGEKVVFKLAGLNDDTGLWPGPYSGITNGTNYQKLIVPVKDLENVRIALETMRFYANELLYSNYPPEKIKQVLVNGLSYDGNALEMYREDVWSTVTQQPLGYYSNQMAWCGNYGVNQVNITHDQGWLLGSNWDSVTRTNAVNIGLNAVGLAGTQTGLIVNSAAPGSYVTKNLNLNVADEKVLRFRFYIDPNSIRMATNDNFRILRLKNTAGTDVCYLSLKQTTNGYHIVSRIFDDSGSQVLSDSVITDSAHYVEVLMIRSESSSASDGEAQLWIDDVQKGALSGIDNYDRFDEAASIQFGNCYADQAQGTSGNFWLDEVKIQGHAEYIGPRYQ